MYMIMPGLYMLNPDFLGWKEVKQTPDLHMAQTRVVPQW